MSPDNLSTSIRKSSHNSNLKASKEDENSGERENGRSTNSSGNGTTTATTIEGNNDNGLMYKSAHHHQQQQQLQHQHQGGQGGEGGGGEDIRVLQQQGSSCSTIHESSSACLLQWGQRKRSRCSRTEGRSMVSVVLEKHGNPIMPPPPHPPLTSSNGGGSSRVRSHTHGHYSKDSPAFLFSKTRNQVDHQMGTTTTNSASPSRNGSGNSSRPISRSTVGKRSPSCVDKNNKVLSSSIRKVKSEDSIKPPTVGGNGNGNGHPVSVSTVADGEKGCEGGVVEWPRIYLSLSRKEKEDDFYAMKGTKLPHRPKKRSKAVDRTLQYCFPGLWLSDLTRARYEVRERKSAKKPKRRGLKGMETMESDSE